MTANEKLYHVTVLSNFARGFDKYSRTYSKGRISESTYPDRFFLLRQEELGIGIEKAKKLLKKLELKGNRLIVLETRLASSLLHPNAAIGSGRYVYDSQIVVTGLHEFKGDNYSENSLQPFTVEDAMAASLRLLNRELRPYAGIRPRAISFLPIALACQAKCPFCFSKASVSSDQTVARPDWGKISAWLEHAETHGAERAVITGGGEPTLLPPATLVQLVATAARQFEKVVLITNGHTLATLSEQEQITRLSALYDAGLRVLAISRHHFDDRQSERLMHLHTPVESLICTWKAHHGQWPELRLRLISVLQDGGVNDEPAVENYLSWAAEQGVEEVCFKELYVSTSAESVYYDRSANEWSRRHQVPLSLITSFVERRGFIVENRLPWGAPVYRGNWQGQPLRVAAYTEPSLFWERTQGVARSWNIMTDGRCHVSLEDRASEIKLEEMT